MALTNSSLDSTKAQHPIIQWFKYLKLLKSQSDIGWYQIKYERWPLQWHRVQQQYEQQMKGITDQGTTK
eukprot:5845334-Ditylum_brightwellii.AAC.1